MIQVFYFVTNIEKETFTCVPVTLLVSDFRCESSALEIYDESFVMPSQNHARHFFSERI